MLYHNRKACTRSTVDILQLSRFTTCLVDHFPVAWKVYFAKWLVNYSPWTSKFILWTMFIKHILHSTISSQSVHSNLFASILIHFRPMNKAFKKDPEEVGFWEAATWRYWKCVCFLVHLKSIFMWSMITDHPRVSKFTSVCDFCKKFIIFLVTRPKPNYIQSSYQYHRLEALEIVLLLNHLANETGTKHLTSILFETFKDLWTWKV